MTSKLTYFTMNFYGNRPTSSAQISVPNLGSTSFSFNAAETSEIEQKIWELVERKKRAIADAVLKVGTPNLITAGTRTIDANGDDIPF